MAGQSRYHVGYGRDVTGGDRDHQAKPAFPRTMDLRDVHLVMQAREEAREVLEGGSTRASMGLRANQVEEIDERLVRGRKPPLRGIDEDLGGRSAVKLAMHRPPCMCSTRRACSVSPWKKPRLARGCTARLPWRKARQADTAPPKPLVPSL